MGATNFVVQVRGRTAEKAFEKARDDAEHEHGSGGYTGTIAEKYSFKPFTLPSGMEPQDFVRRVECSDTEGLTRRDARVIELAAEIFDNKRGPAVCFVPEDGVFVFFGLASE